MSATDGCYPFGRSGARGLVLARCVTPLCLLLPLCYLYLLSTCNFIAIAFVLHATFFYQILPDLHSYSSFWQLPYARFRGLILESSLQGPARLPCTHADSGGLLLLPPGPCTLACAQCPAQSASPLSHTLTPEACSSFLQRCVLVVAHRRPLSPPDSVYGKGFWFVWGLFVWLLAAAPRSPLLSRGSFRNVRGRCGINIQIIFLFSPYDVSRYDFVSPKSGRPSITVLASSLRV